MDPYQPKKMPESLRGKYRDPINVRELFTGMLSSKEHRALICDSVAESLSRRYGMIYFSHNGEDIPVTSFRQHSRMHTVEFIDLLSSVDDYGGQESVSAELAASMQPSWKAWWDLFGLRYPESDLQVLSAVLGEKQMLWIAAQIARRSIMFADSAAPTLIKSIDLIEDWIVGKANREFSGKLIGIYLSEIVDSINRIDVLNESPSSSADAVLTLVEHASNSSVPGFVTFASAALSSVIASASYADGFDKNPEADADLLNRNILIAQSSCADVARAVFTPTLITTPSRGLR